jgi:glucose/arabinose dehydrogenase
VDANRVYRFRWDGAVMRDTTLITELPVTPGPNHDGGILRMGPDGKLYVVIGDLNRNGKLENFPAGPDPDDTGVVLRLEKDGSTPADNPFAGAGDAKLERVFAYGVRNSFGMAFDPWTDELWMTVNGPSSYDEIDRVEPGANLGWEQIHGPDARDAQGVGDLWMAPGAFYSDPEFSFLSPPALTALTFLGASYRDDLEGDCVVSDFNFSRLYRLEMDASRDRFALADSALLDLVADDNSAEVSSILIGTGWGGVVDLRTGPDGWTYALSLFDGTLYRLRDVSPELTGAPAPIPGSRGPRFVSSDPNPANPSARVRFDLTAAGQVRVDVLDVSGRLVRNLVEGALSAGRHTAVWDGTDAWGRPVASGVYLVRVSGVGGVSTGKVALVR